MLEFLKDMKEEFNELNIVGKILFIIGTIISVGIFIIALPAIVVISLILISVFLCEKYSYLLKKKK